MLCLVYLAWLDGVFVISGIFITKTCGFVFIFSEKKYAGLKKSTLPLVVAVVTNMSYVQEHNDRVACTTTPDF